MGTQGEEGNTEEIAQEVIFYDDRGCRGARKAEGAGHSCNLFSPYIFLPAQGWAAAEGFQRFSSFEAKVSPMARLFTCPSTNR